MCSILTRTVHLEPGTSPNHWKNVHLTTLPGCLWKKNIENRIIWSNHQPYLREGWYQILSNPNKWHQTFLESHPNLESRTHFCWHSWMVLALVLCANGDSYLALETGIFHQVDQNKATHKKKRALHACSSSRQSDRRQEISWDLPQAVNGIAICGRSILWMICATEKANVSKNNIILYVIFYCAFL